VSAIQRHLAQHGQVPRLMAVRRDGAVYLSDCEAHLCSSLPPGTYIVKETRRQQAVILHKHLLRRRHKGLPTLTLAPQAGGWEVIRSLAPSTYVVTDADRAPRYVLTKLGHSHRWETILLHRFECWLRGEELDAETEHDLTRRLAQLADQMK
jgi:hypothetical protein